MQRRDLEKNVHESKNFFFPLVKCFPSEKSKSVKGSTVVCSNRKWCVISTKASIAKGSSTKELKILIEAC